VSESRGQEGARATSILVLRALALAMGVASVVLLVLDAAQADEVAILQGLGLLALAIASLAARSGP
jgi:hypothetical protein